VAREDGPRYEPPDAFAAPRYTGVKTFARCPLDSPAYDGPGAPTAVAASKIAYELLTLDVLATRPE